jgi:Protein of unknown function (DUF2911)
MPFKTKVFTVVFAILPVLFFACNQKTGNQPTSETKNLRIPVSVSDSLVLAVDKSPMDMSYFPEEYPKQKMATANMANPIARVIYSRPQKNGRIIFADSSTTGNIIQYYGHEWRLGANEATEIEFFKAVTVNGKKIPTGRYILYCIPYPNKWKMIINQNLYSWGLHIDKSKDITEMEIPITKKNMQAEYFSMLFQKAVYGCNLVMEWGDVKAVLPINFN